MAVLIRRFLTLQLLLLWQGGFVFYAAVVVPIGTDFLGSATEQGFITQRVTLWLNRIGWIALLVFAWDTARTRETKRWRRDLRWASLILVAVLLALLDHWLHGELTRQLDLQDHRFRNRTGFYSRHAWYLILSTIQWAGMLAYAWFTLSAWRAEDRNASNS